jgi:hypothetical protein
MGWQNISIKSQAVVINDEDVDIIDKYVTVQLHLHASFFKTIFIMQGITYLFMLYFTYTKTFITRIFTNLMTFMALKLRLLLFRHSWPQPIWLSCSLKLRLPLFRHSWPQPIWLSCSLKLMLLLFRHSWPQPIWLSCLNSLVL